MRLNIEGGRLESVELAKVIKMAGASFQPADNYVVTVDHPTYMSLDANGAAKDVLLPLASTARNLVFIISNSSAAAFAIVVKDSTDTTTFVSIAQNGLALLVCDGVRWYAAS